MSTRGPGSGPLRTPWFPPVRPNAPFPNQPSEVLPSPEVRFIDDVAALPRNPECDGLSVVPPKPHPPRTLGRGLTWPQVFADVISEGSRDGMVLGQSGPNCSDRCPYKKGTQSGRRRGRDRSDAATRPGAQGPLATGRDEAGPSPRACGSSEALPTPRPRTTASRTGREKLLFAATQPWSLLQQPRDTDPPSEPTMSLSQLTAGQGRRVWRAGVPILLRASQGLGRGCSWPTGPVTVTGKRKLQRPGASGAPPAPRLLPFTVIPFAASSREPAWLQMS